MASKKKKYFQQSRRRNDLRKRRESTLYEEHQNESVLMNSALAKYHLIKKLYEYIRISRQF